MVNQQLSISGPFEGILGLGRPEVVTEPGQVSIPSFLELANDPRFSMCFNYNSDGVLSLNTPIRDRAMNSVGKMHWALDFRGISVGGEAQPVMFCSPAEKEPGMETACGIIPDSGTTLILGSGKHINLLFGDLCQRWELCRATHADMVEQLKTIGKKPGVSLTEEKSRNTAETSQWARTKVKLADGLRKFRAALQSNSANSKTGANFSMSTNVPLSHGLLVFLLGMGALVAVLYRQFVSSIVNERLAPSLSSFLNFIFIRIFTETITSRRESHICKRRLDKGKNQFGRSWKRL